MRPHLTYVVPVCNHYLKGHRAFKLHKKFLCVTIVHQIDL